MAELGRIERPDASVFEGKRKLYCVSNVYLFKDAPDEYRELVERYWEEVALHLKKLEPAGKIGKIFCEGVKAGGEEGLEELTGINRHALPVVREKIEEGAVLLPLESEETLGPFIDWRNCLAVVRTEEVSSRVLRFYAEAYEKRIGHIQEVIERNTGKGEAVLLIMADDDRMRLRLPADVEVFLVTPPSYDTLLRWLRERLKEST